MVDLLLSEDRKHLPNKVCRSEVNYLTVYNSNLTNIIGYQRKEMNMY